VGPVYQAGTLSGNPVALAAGMATLKLIQAPGFYEKLAETTRQLCERLTGEARKAGVTFCANSVGGMFGMYFRETPPASYAEVMTCDKEMFNRFFHAMLAHGIYFAPSAFEAGFVSSAHGPAEIEKTVQAAAAVFATLR
jgi:glutamate-1-semialdehyde 2,1-aminomutase